MKNSDKKYLYCTYSNNNGKSDVYLWDDNNGSYHIHVSSHKILKYSGERFVVNSPSAALDVLINLNKKGFHVPISVMQDLEKEIVSEKKVSFFMRNRKEIHHFVRGFILFILGAVTGQLITYFLK